VGRVLAVTTLKIKEVKMLEFVVEAPFDLPLYKKNLTKDKLDANPPKEWSRLRGFSGCYIFVVPRKRVPSELIPIYVGKAGHSFEQECFTSEKLVKINRFLLDYHSDRLSLILIRHPNRRGHINESAIDELEMYLIKLAVSVNHALINKKGTKPEKWGIRGIIRGGRGHVSQSANTLRALLGLSVEEVKAKTGDSVKSIAPDAPSIGAASPILDGGAGSSSPGAA